MKKILLAATATLVMVACGSRSKLNSDIRAYRSNVARTASYNSEHADLFLKLQQVVSNRYTIAKESESKGTITTEVKESSNEDKSRTTKTWLEAEIVGSKKPYRVDFQHKTERRNTKNLIGKKTGNFILEQKRLRIIRSLPRLRTHGKMPKLRSP